MDLGPFSLSLAVKDIEKSLEFYAKMGFAVIDGGHVSEGFPDDGDKKWRLVRNGDCTFGLFQGMFDANILTFNPDDVRGVQEGLKLSGVMLVAEADDGSGPGHAMVVDPDGNMILLDQH